MLSRLRVVPHFSSGIVEPASASARENHPTRRHAAAREVSPCLAWGYFHARSRFARSTIPEEKWGTTRSLSALTTTPFLAPLHYGLCENGE